MMAAGAPTLDVHDHGLGRHLGRDADHRANLLDRAGLEHHVGDPGGVELFDQLDGLLQVRYARADDHAVDRGARLAGPLHEPLAADLQLPQIGVEEKGVELNRTPGLEQRGQLVDAVGEYLLGDLATTGELGPVTRIGGRGDDLRVDGGGRHPREQDRRAAGEAGELGGELHAAVGQADQTRRVGRPRAGHLRHRTGGEKIALPAAGGGRDDTDAQPADHRRRQPREHVARAEVENPASPGLVHRIDGRDPVHRADQEIAGQLLGVFDVESDLCSPTADHVDRGGQSMGVEADLDLQWVEDGSEDGAAAHFVLPIGGLSLGDLLAVQLEARQLFRRAGDDDRAAAVANGEHRWQNRTDVLGELLEQRLDAFRVGVGHRDHRRTIAQGDDPAAARHERRRRADQLGQGKQFHVLAAGRLHRFDGQQAARVACQRDGRCVDEVHALPGQRANRRHLRQEDARKRCRRRGEVLGARDGIAGCQVTHPAHRLETDRAHDDEVAGDGFEKKIGLAGQRRELVLDAGGGYQFLECFQPGSTLAAEDHRVGLARDQTIDQCAGIVRWEITVAPGRHSVVFVDRHVLYISLCLRFESSACPSRAALRRCGDCPPSPQTNGTVCASGETRHPPVLPTGCHKSGRRNTRSRAVGMVTGGYY